MKWEAIPAGDLFLQEKKSIDPRQHPDQEYELYSIPAYESNQPELVKGRDIGSTKQVVRQSDVLLSRIVPHIRRAWIVNGDTEKPKIASGEWIIFRDERVWPPYLRQYLRSDRFHAHFMSTVAGVGGSLLRARPSGVAEIPIPLPPIEEQKRIAAILDKADRLRSLREQAIAKLDQLAQSIFLDMFGDPVTNPKGWEVTTLGRVGTLERGKSQHRPRNDPLLLGGSYPLIQTGDVANSGGYIRGYSQSYSELGLKQSRKWPRGTLCITIAANIADTGILTFEACFPDSVVGFTPGSGTNTEYVRGWLELIKTDIEQIAPESAQKNINLQILRNLPIPLPPRELQERYANAIGTIEALRSQYRLAKALSTDSAGSLTQRAFKGEL